MKIKSFVYGFLGGLFLPLAATDFMTILMKDPEFRPFREEFCVTSDQLNQAIVEGNTDVLGRLLDLPTEDAWRMVCCRDTKSGKSPLETFSERYPSVEPAEFFGQFISRRLDYGQWE
ncbi:hypothetical protein JW872_00465 [Candidatus Babeliales bacterium]|nr:hypothetical protein [Candidatus Babeliales bacterium]